MIRKTIPHYKILEKLGEACLHLSSGRQARLRFGFVGQGEPNYAKALLDRLALRPVLRSFSEGGSPSIYFLGVS